MLYSKLQFLIKFDWGFFMNIIYYTKYNKYFIGIIYYDPTSRILSYFLD